MTRIMTSTDLARASVNNATLVLNGIAHLSEIELSWQAFDARYDLTACLDDVDVRHVAPLVDVLPENWNEIVPGNDWAIGPLQGHLPFAWR